MKLELPVRLATPLNLCVIFISFAGFDLFDALGFGFWKYVIVAAIMIAVMWLLQKTGISEKQVPLWAGAFIILLGFIVGLIFDKWIVA